MSSPNYQQLALAWSPDSKTDRLFAIITSLVVITLLILAIFISSIPLPVKERQIRQEIPERIANFLLEKKKGGTENRKTEA